MNLEYVFQFYMQELLHIFREAAAEVQQLIDFFEGQDLVEPVQEVGDGVVQAEEEELFEPVEEVGEGVVEDEQEEEEEEEEIEEEEHDSGVDV